ncbi:ribonuclease Z [Paenibacillus pini JCM 16418]|uniref:Ribonuclease Z n=1 Tax=Paenibacillus pini JCM 16418 TaxID=1236976 RepID=W7YGD8_9BACL|nr:ribonuclease Z [Paenibacillus pini JCM 16418]
MELEFLGTNAGTPSLQRNVTSMALRMFEERRTFWLFDCGEGTQHQILRSSLKLSKLEHIWITHLHGDHIFGLPGLMSSRSNQGGTTPLTVFGPPGLKSFLETSLNISQSRMEYEWTVVEHEGGMIYEDDEVKVESLKLEHRIDSYGYRVVEKDKAGS